MKKICVYEFVICLVFNNYTLEQCSVMLRTPQGYNLEKKQCCLHHKANAIKVIL